MITIGIAAAAFLVGVIAGVILLLRAGITREESDRSLLDEPATRAARATRRVVGLYVRTPQPVTEADDVPAQTDPGQSQQPPTARPDR
jgi:hypothetical protein